MLSSSNCFIVSGIPMFVLLARTYLCRGDNLLRCSYLMCLRKSFVSLKRKPNTVGQDTNKGASVSTFSSHSWARAARFTKHLSLQKCLHIASSRRCQIREDCFAHRAHIGGRHLRNAPACISKDWACTSCATLASCVAPNSLHLSSSFAQHLH